MDTTATRIAKADREGAAPLCHKVKSLRVQSVPTLHPRSALLIVGLLLLGGCIVLRVWSVSLTSAVLAGVELTVLLVVLLSAMGGLFLWTAHLVPRLPSSTRAPLLLIACVGIGLLMRLSQWTAAPVYEKDYLRYFWDGAVISSGIDPYVNTPASIATKRLLCSLRRGPSPNVGLPEDCILSDLANESRGLVDQISYGYVTTIYPPMAQLAFAAAYRLHPFSVEAWRSVLLCAELLGVTALLGALLAVGENPLWALLYWWNPIVIVNIANGVHLEALLVPFLVAALWAMSRQRVMTAAVALAVASAIKIWPLLLLPSLLSASADARHNRRAAILGVALSGLLLWPQLRHLGPDSGATVFAAEWVRNAFAFPWLVKAWNVLVPEGVYADRAARLSVVIVVLLLSVRNALAGPADIRTWAQRWGANVAALFLFAPTGYPWYFIGLLPFLCFWRAGPLLLLSVTLPLYFSLYILEPLKNGRVLSECLMTAEFLPVWAGLGWMAWRRTTGGEAI